MALASNVSYDSKDNILRARFSGGYIGLDTTASLTDIDPRALRVADNCNIEENGSISKRKGLDPKVTYANRFVHNGLEFRPLTGAVKLAICTKQAGANSAELYSQPVGFGAGVLIANALANQRPSLSAAKGLLFYYNGVDDFLWDGGAGTRQIGITPPVAAPTFNANIPGSLVNGGSYIYAYTYYNSVTGAESSPSPPSAVIVAGAMQGIRINITAGAAATADTIRIYRTVANGTILFLDSTAVIAATTFDSTKADAGLGKQLELDNSRPSVWGKFKYSISAENRIYLTGLSTNLNRIHVSAVYSEGPHPESFPAKNFADCESSKGLTDYNVGLGIAGNTIIVNKRFSVGRIEKIGIDSTVSSEDPMIFLYREISRSVNSLSHFAGCNLYGEWVWLGYDNIYATDGTQVRPVADRIRKTIRDLGLLPSDKYSAFNDTENKRLYFSVTSGAAECNWVIAGYYKDYPEIYWTIHKPGVNTTTHPGVRAGCFFNTIDWDGTRRIMVGNNDLLGQIWEYGKVDSDNVAGVARGIAWKARFTPVTYGLEEEEKYYFKDIIVAQGSGGNYNLTAESIYSLSDTPYETELVSLFANLNNWGAFQWGNGYWGANIPLTVSHNSNSKAFRKQLQLSNINALEPVVVYSFDMQARPTYFRG